MSVRIVTQTSEWYDLKPIHKSGLEHNASVGSIVSVGIQTNEEQDNFSIAQNFVCENGKRAYVQVVNDNLTKSVGWRLWVTLLRSDDEDTSTSESAFSSPVDSPLDRSVGAH